MSFDLDDTLVSESAYIISRWEEALLGLGADFQNLSSIIEPTVKKHGHKSQAILDIAMIQVGTDLELKPILLKAYRESIGKDGVIPGGIAALETLRNAGFRVGILTNGPQNAYMGRIRRTPLLDLIDFAYFGDHAQKPNPRAFFQCIEGEGILPSQLVHVGDDAYCDDFGARLVGATSVLIREFNEEDRVLRGQNNRLRFDSLDDFVVWMRGML